MKLTILGGPGAGKGTQAKWLCGRLNISWIAIGEILRRAIASGTDLGKLAQPYVEKGELIPDETMIQFVRQQLLQPDVSNGWLLDGYPRTAFQAEELDFLLDELGQKLDWAIYLEVPPDILINRTMERSRADDRPEIVKRRIDLFHARTIELVEYYEHKKRLLRIDGEGAIAQVQQDILNQLNAAG